MKEKGAGRDGIDGIQIEKGRLAVAGGALNNGKGARDVHVAYRTVGPDGRRYRVETNTDVHPISLWIQEMITQIRDFGSDLSPLFD